MYRDNYIKALRSEMLEMVAEQLTPVALRYGYSDVPLETTIKWRPQVLVLGSYSSGKSTLINDFLGLKVQATGQAPTDDSFTVITYDDSLPADAPPQVTETRDGKYLLNDSEYPFESLKKHGQRFAAHFRLKKVNAPFLKNLAIIDTPGMLDSITERDRGYDYQEVIGDLAQIVDLVLVLFDPHKAGTVREAHTSLRETLPSRTFEDRVLFVLNRIDECASMIDLLRVYGTLCWNLSQITGRKDIPMIHLTYAQQEAEAQKESRDLSYLRYLENQREELKKAVQQAPTYRLDNLASFVETHGQRLAHLLEALIAYRKKTRRFSAKGFLTALVYGILAGGGAIGLTFVVPPLMGTDIYLKAAIGGGTALLFLGLWATFLRHLFYKRFHRKTIKQIDSLTPLFNQTRRDSWEAVRDIVTKHLQNTGGRFSLREVRREHANIAALYQEGSKEIREALRELANLSEDEEAALGLNRVQAAIAGPAQTPPDPATNA
ncbi:dynamin family protein [Desulfatitalea alkaliphila]|uniref:Dynamin family protein n=1 Tax=Desulfatitalea alkaliphila TaxID=2929485 RepID=A0AA41R132_9BACT|nr:dynamin family protein [Desulfatitalea alkaliphila]MCJ8500049.1 dynamin family protein [Desulfatitalea alkaliphila]